MRFILQRVLQKEWYVKTYYFTINRIFTCLFAGDCTHLMFGGARHMFASSGSRCIGDGNFNHDYYLKVQTAISTVKNREPGGEP